MKEKCIIIGASKESQLHFDSTNSYVIAVDAGYIFLKQNHIKPDLIVGDFDSLQHEPSDIQNIIKLNPIKDVTDTHVAIEEAIKQGYKKIDIYGCLNGRIEHSVAILQDVYGFLKKHNDLVFTLYSFSQRIVFIYNNEMTFNEDESGFISVFAYDYAKHVTIKCLKYEVNDVTFTNDFPLGVSNEFINKKATIKVEDGCLMVII